MIAQSITIGNIKKSLDNFTKKAIAAIDKVSIDYIENASEEELKSLDSYGDEMEKEIQRMQDKLDEMRHAVQAAQATVAERARREKEEKILAEAQAIMAARSSGVEETPAVVGEDTRPF